MHVHSYISKFKKVSLKGNVQWVHLLSVLRGFCGFLCSTTLPNNIINDDTIVVFIVFAVASTGKPSNLPIKNYKYTQSSNSVAHFTADKYSEADHAENNVREKTCRNRCN